MRKSIKVLIIILALIVIFLATQVNIGVSKNNLARDAGVPNKIEDGFLVEQHVNDDMASYLVYSDNLKKHTFSIYEKRDGLSFGYFFISGGSSSDIAQEIRKMDFKNGSVLLSLNKVNASKIELDKGTEPVEVINLNKGRPFTVIIPKDIQEIRIYDINGNLIPIEEEGYTNNEKVVDSSSIDKKQIYRTLGGGDMSWAKDPKNPSNLLKTLNGNDSSVVKVKVKSIEEAIFFEKTDKFYVRNPFTPIKIEIENHLHGEKLENIDTVYLDGGNVRISELLKNRDVESAEKMGLNELTEQQKNEMYMSYTSEYDYKLKVGEEYTFILVKQGNGIHTINSYGYGIFKEDTSSLAKSDNKQKKSKKTFKNVLTGRELIDENGETISLEE